MRIDINKIIKIIAMKKLMILFSGIIMVAGMGCKKDYLDINSNPNTATNTTPELVLPNALNSTAARQINGGASNYTFISGWMGYWAVSGSYALNTSDFSTYKQTTFFGDGLWSDIYNNLEDYDYIEQQGIAQNKPFYEAAAKIMKAYNFQQLVDMFNNVPYSDAFKGTTAITPKFDAGQDIYDSLVININSAVALLARTDAQADASSDILFGGDTEKWRQFANSLKLRILMRQSQVASRTSYIQTEIANTVAEGSGFLTVEAGVNPGYINSAGKQNPFYGSSINPSGTYIQDFWRANQYSVQFFKDNNDPRLTLVYGPTPSNSSLYQGNYLGQSNNAYVGSASSIFGPGVLKSFDQDAIIMSAAESYFLQAEAALRGWLDADVQSLYQAGVTASFEYLGVPDADAAAEAYTDQPGNSNVYWDESQSFNYKLALIIRQKWAAENTVTPFEAWADYRRLHLPADIQLSQSPYVDILLIPYRVKYPNIEYSTNAENVNAVTPQGDNYHQTDKIWWMP